MIIKVSELAASDAIYIALSGNHVGPRTQVHYTRSDGAITLEVAFLFDIFVLILLCGIGLMSSRFYQSLQPP